MSTAVAAITLLITAATGLFTVALSIPLLQNYGVYDVPNARSAHAKPVPRGAGFVLVPVFALVTWMIATPPVFAIVGLIGMACIGALDDLGEVGAGCRLAAQLVTAIVTGTLLAIEYRQVPWVLATLTALGAAVGLVLAVNAVNFMDGINGISGLYAVVGGVSFLVFGLMWQANPLTVGGAAMAGIGLALLPFNVPVARVFLGDSGSYGLGAISFVLVVLSIASGVPWWLATAPMHLYLCDVLLTLFRRALGRRSLLSAHREHIYQRLLENSGGYHVPVATLVALASTLEIGLLLIAARAADAQVALILVATAAAVLIAYSELPALALRRAVH